MDTRLLWLALGGFAGGNESFVIGSLLPAIGVDLGVTVGEAGYTVFAYALVYAISTPIFSGLLGRVDRRRVLVGAELTFAAGAVLVSLAPTLPLLVAARVIVAMGAGLFTATAIATAVGMSPPERRGRAIAVVAGGQSLAVLVGVPLGALVASTFGWRTVYVLLAILALIAATGMRLRLPAGLAGDLVALRERLKVVRLPGIPVAYLATLVFMVSAYMPLIFIAPLAAGAGMSHEFLPIALFANGLGAVAGAQAGGRLADRLGATRAVTIASLAQIVILFGYALSVTLPSAVAPYLFVPLIAAGGFVGWSFWPAESSLVAGLSPAAPALALSLNLTALNIGVALAARIGGVVVDNFGVIWLGLASVPFAIVALVALRLFSPRRTK